MKQVQPSAQAMKSILGLNSSTVGVKFYLAGEIISADTRRLDRRRYCQALMKARHGCSDATDIGPNETGLGFLFREFKEIVQTLEFLNEKAIPSSRGKYAYALLRRKETENIEKTDPYANPLH